MTDYVYRVQLRRPGKDWEDWRKRLYTSPPIYLSASPAKAAITRLSQERYYADTEFRVVRYALTDGEVVE